MYSRDNERAGGGAEAEGREGYTLSLEPNTGLDCEAQPHDCQPQDPETMT